MAFLVFDMVAVPVKISDDFIGKFIALDFDAAQNIFFLVTSNRFWDYIYKYPIFKINNSLNGIVGKGFEVLDRITEH